MSTETAAAPVKKVRVQRKPKETVLARTYVECRQGWKLTTTERLEMNGVVAKIQTVVYVDSYSFQSYCRTLLWDGTEWKRVASLPYQNMRSVKNRELGLFKAAAVPQNFTWDHHEVRRLALAIIF